MMRGFSLVELSIVLVILGLLTGGILAGQALIRAAELRSVSTAMQRYHTAVYSFRDKYFEIPGDMSQATRFWLSAGGTGSDAACIAAQTGGAANTCNGNGNGQVYNPSTGPADMLNTERFLAWKHLANAGLIEGSYTGKTTGAAGSGSFGPATNIPASRLASGFYDLCSPMGSAPDFFAGTDVTKIVLTHAGAPAKPAEVWSFDLKLDDGSPATGTVFNTISTVSGCTDSTSVPANYALTSSSAACNFYYAVQ